MVENAFELGWQVIKLYFMIGLPGETTRDLEEMVELVKEIHKLKAPKGRKGKINVSVNTFIPKSHTPFQWAGQLSLEESREKIEWLKRELRLPRVQFKWQKPENSFLEGLWARGDRRLSGLLLTAFEKDCRFDGWSDHFQFEKWQEAILETETDSEFFVTRTRNIEEPLPWDHIDSRITKTFLEKEWQRAKEGGSTMDCRSASCTQCGSCDHDTIRPRFSNSEKIETVPFTAAHRTENDFFKTVSVSYSKQGSARFFGHLELMNILLRAIRRARIPVAYSQGFHPLPKISFDDPLPLGYESREEFFRMKVSAAFRPDDLLRRLGAELPEGLRLHDCQIAAAPSKAGKERLETYEITLLENAFDVEKIEQFRSSPEVKMVRRNRKGKTMEIDLKQTISEMELLTPDRIKMVLSIKSGMTVRPGLVIAEIFNLKEADVKAARILKTMTEYP